MTDETQASGPGDLVEIASGFGLYIHVPFCTTRCDYCAFATWTGREDEIDTYVDALCMEITRSRKELFWRSPATVFFGGGTPSLLNAHQVERILTIAEPQGGAEITIECNPESTTKGFIRDIAACGVNRTSLGVQSRKSHVLAGLGRGYFEGALENALEAIAQGGISNYNIDLIYGGAGETSADFTETLVEVLLFAPPPKHISAYALTIEAGTPLAKSPDRHPDEDEQAERYELADEILSGHGMRWYEISNWAVPGYECRHNLSCWLGGEYLGVGCAAHSHIDGVRSANVFSLDRYLQATKEGRSPIAKSEQLKGRDRAEELLELQLRTRVGIVSQFVEQRVIADGLMEEHGGRRVLNLRGRMLANEAAMHLLPPDDPRDVSGFPVVGLSI